jgi:hypothetical protein
MENMIAIKDFPLIFSILFSSSCKTEQDGKDRKNGETLARKRKRFWTHLRENLDPKKCTKNELTPLST